MKYEITVTSPTGASKVFNVELARDRETGSVLCRVNGEPLELDALSSERDVLSLLLAGDSCEFRHDSGQVTRNGVTYRTEVRDPRSWRNRRSAADAGDGPKKVTAPMPGKVVRILVPEGSAVEAGQGVLVIEAMKMQNEMKSPKSGIVRKINAAEGAAVNAGDTLAVIE